MVFKNLFSLIFINCVFIILPGHLAASTLELQVGAAASLQDVLQDAGKAWLKNTGIKAKINYNFAGTSTLVRQVKWGAPLDIFIGASKKNTDEIIKSQLSVKESLRDLASNHLVLISSISEDTKNLDLNNIAKHQASKIATCDEAVPIGFYTHSYLRKVGLYKRLQPKFVYTDNARSILSMVANKTVPYGFVYLTDALTETNKVKVVQEVSPLDHAPIKYLGLALARSKAPIQKLAVIFLDFLASPEGQKIFSKHGFKKAGSQIATR